MIDREKNTLYGRVYDIQPFSVHDGPGIRTTVFLKGCPLRCPWCHSPESQAFEKQVCHMPMRCMGTDKCGACISACPEKAIIASEPVFSTTRNEIIRQTHIDRSKCSSCGKCVQACFSEALFLSGKDYTPDALMEKISPDLNFFSESGGGVTLSGGEPMSQPEFAKAFLKKCREAEIHTALDTTGFAPYARYADVFDYVNLFLYDLKHMDSTKHREVIGVPNERILNNAVSIAKAGGHFQIRIPVIPGFNDDEDNLRRTGEFCSQMGDAVRLIQFLPFHPFGKAKYERLGLHYAMKDVLSPSDERMEQIRELMLQYSDNVTIH